METNIPQISPAEWQVMKVLWEHPGLTAVQVHNEVCKENHWSDGTTRTYLRRLVEKGAVRYRQDENDSRIYYYFPVISQEEALKQKSRSLSRIIKDKMGLVLAFLVRESELTDEEIEELENLLKEKRGKAK